MKSLNFDTSRWKLLNNILVLGIALYGQAVHDYQSEKTSFFQRAIIDVVAPMQQGTSSLRDRVAAIFDHYIQIVETSKENVKLRGHIDELESKLFRMDEIERENDRLKRLLQFGSELELKKVLAQVVSWDASSEFKVLRVNKGRADGLKLLSPVITTTGLVGHVYRLSANYADILTILDQNNRVDAIVARTRTHGIIEGRSGFTCQLKYVARTEKLELGDEIVTAGLGEIYPKGIKIGKIIKINKENYGITQSVEIGPSVDFHRLEEVVVLIKETKAKVE